MHTSLINKQVRLLALSIICITFSFNNVFAQSSDIKIQLGIPNAGETRFAVCGGVRKITVKVENISTPNLGDTLKNVTTTVDLSTVLGIYYNGVVNLLSASDSNYTVTTTSLTGSAAPIFTLPNFDTAGSFVLFEVELYTSCDAIPMASGSASPNFNVVTNYSKGGLLFSKSKNTGSFEVVKPSLSIPSIQGNPVVGITKTGSLAGILDPVAGQTDTLRAKVVNAGFGSVDRLIYWVKDQPILTLQKVMLGNYQLVPIGTNGDTTFYEVPTIALSQAIPGVGSFINNTSLFQYNESLYFTEYWYADQCQLNTPDIIRGVYYGCDGTALGKCEQAVTTSGIRFSIRRPILNTYTQYQIPFLNNGSRADYRESTPACYQTDGVKTIYAMVNSGTGPASDVRFNLGAYPAEWNRSIDTATTEIKTGWNGSWTHINAWKTTLSGQNGSCPSSANTIRRANYELGTNFLLNAGDTLYIRFKSVYSCGCNSIANNQCGTMWYYYYGVFGWTEGNDDANYHNQNTYTDPCGLSRYNLSQVGQTSFQANMPNFMQGPANIYSGQVNTLNTNITSFSNSWLDNYLGTGRRSDYDNATIRYYYVIDEGLDWEGTNGDVNTTDFIFYGNDNVTKWKPSAIKYIDNGYGLKDTLIIDFAFKDYPYSGNIGGLRTILKYKSDCSEIPPACKTAKKFREWITFSTSSTCASCTPGSSLEQPIGCPNEQGVNIYCTCGPCVGLSPLVFNLTRKNYEIGDNNNNHKSDVGEYIDTALVQKKRFISGDTIVVRYKGVFSTDATHPQWENAFNVINVPTSTVPSMSITPVGATAIIKDVDASGTLVGTYNANVLEQIPQGNQIYTNLSPANLKTLGNTGVPNSFSSYSAGDTIEVLVMFRAFDSTYNRIWQDGVNVMEFSENSFAAHTPMPVAAGNRYACDAFNDRMVYVKMHTWSYAWGEWSMDLGGCTPGNIDNYYTGFTIGDPGSYDYFPYEIRKPKAELQQTRYVKQSGMEWNNLIVDIGTEWDDPAPVNINPLTSSLISIVGDTMYFNAQQYMADYRLANPNIRFDQGYYIHFTPQVTGTCKVPTSNTYIENKGTTNNYATDPNVFGTTSLTGLTKLTITPTRNDTELGVFYRTYTYRYTKAANLLIQTGVTTQTLLGGEACFEVQISNIGESDATLTWLNLKSPSGGVVIKSVTETTNPASPITFTPVLGIYRLGNTAAQGTTIRTFKFCITSNNCDRDSIVLQSGWNCTSYPVTLQESECGTPFKFYVEPAPSVLDMVIKKPLTTVSTNLCTQQEYILQVTSANLGSLNHIQLQFDMPDGQSYIPGSFQYAYPNTSADPSVATWLNEKDPINLYGNTWKINLSDSGLPTPHPILSTSGLPGTVQVGENFMFVKFNTNLNCGLSSGGHIDFLSWAYNACNKLANYKNSPAAVVKISGLPDIYRTDITLTSGAVNPCNNDRKRINIEFLIQAGSIPSGAGDSIRVILPPGMDYFTGSIIAGSNASNTPPIIINANGQKVLYFSVTPGLPGGSVVKFSFEVISSDAQQDCRAYTIKAQTFTSQSALCGGTACSVRNISDESTAQINFIKPDLAITAFSASTTGVPPSQERVDYQLTVQNFGENIPAGATTNIEVYSDVNNNGQFDLGTDLLLFTATTNYAIANGSSINIIGSALVTAGKTCKLLAVINPATTCVCTKRVSFQVEPDITMPFARDTNACSGVTLVNLGPPAFNASANISYQWYGYNGSATTPLSAINTSPVNFTQNNTTGSQLNNTYVIRVIRNNDCVSYDTVNVHVFPVIKDSIQSQTCAGTATIVSGPNNGTNYTWTANPTAVFSTPTASSSVIPNGIIQTTRFLLNYKDNNGCTAVYVDNKSVVNCSPNTALGDTVWYDFNKNGIQDIGEPPIEDIVVQLFDPANLATPLKTTTTNANGYYIFDTLPAGSYRVKFILPTGKNAVFTTKDAGSDDAKDSDADKTTGLAPAVYLPNGSRNMTIDAGIYYSGTLGNYVWKDVNGDGLQNDGNTNGINGIKVFLYKDNGTGVYIKTDSITTANDANGNAGYYLFTNLNGGDYKVLFPTSQSGGKFPLTITNPSTKTDSNSDANTITGLSGVATINLFGTGQDINNTTIDAGYKTNIGTLGNYVWTDTNGDGLQNEPAINGINGVKIYLYKPGASGTIGGADQILIDSATTANDTLGKSGYYLFTNLASGNYYVKFPITNAGYPLTNSNQAVTTDGNSDANTNTGYSAIAIINVNGSGQQVNNSTIDAGYKTNIGSLGNFVWSDDNGNGLQDDGVLSGINGVKVYLYKTGLSGVIGGTDQILIDSTTTANNAAGLPGAYIFSSLPSGDYYVKFPTNVGNYLITPTTNQATTTDGNNDANTIGYSGKITLDVTGSGVQINNYTIDAGYKTNIGNIGNYVWKDNGDGVQNDGTGNGVNGVKVFLYSPGADGIVGNADDIKLDSTTTSTNAVGNTGYYIFSDLKTGAYYVKFPVTLFASPLTIANQLDKTDGNSDANITTGNSAKVLLNTASNIALDVNNATIDAGYVCNVPQPTIIGGIGYCPSDSVILTASAGFQGYQWYLNGVAITNATNITYASVAVGNYTVTMQDANGCVSNTSLPKAIIAFSTPPTPSDTVIGTTTKCAPDSIKISSTTSTGSYQWYKNGVAIVGATSQDYFAKTTGNYSVKTISNNGCPSAASAEIFITIIPNPTPIIDVRSSTALCPGASVMLCPLNFGFSNYQWYKNGVAIAAPTGVGACITVTDAASYTLKGTNGAGCWSAFSDTVVVTTVLALPKPTITASGATTFCNGASVTLTSSALSGNVWLKDGNNTGTTTNSYTVTQSGIYTIFVAGGTCSSDTSLSIIVTNTNPVTGFSVSNTTNVCDSTVTFTATTVAAGSTIVWSFGDGSTATGNTVSHKYASPNSYIVKQIITGAAPTNCKDSLTQNVTVNSCNVTSGSSGGVESKTLGDVIATRLYGNAINSIVEINGYNNTLKFVQNSGTVTNGNTNDITLSSLVPTTVINTDAAFVKTPTDLLSLVTASEVIAIDYTKNNITKAVAFATKTLGDVYAHTKPICDRLKGATLLEIKTIKVKNCDIVVYKILQCTGEVEFVGNISAGTNTGSNTIIVQSNWLVSNYQPNEKLYNFQLWAVNYNLVAAMATDIIAKLEKFGNINTISNTDQPNVFVTKGKRIGTEISLLIQNNTTATSGYFEIKEKATETSVETTRQVMFNLLSKNQTALSLKAGDYYEATINMFINGIKTDVLYLNDGTWNNDYVKNTSTLKGFEVTNEKTLNATANIDEYRLMRNVNISALTKDYISVYKTIGTSCNALDISNYKSIKFNATALGAGSVTITLVSSSITNWENQYSYTINLDGNKEYAVQLSDFKSKLNNTLVNSNTITTISFTFNSSRFGISTLINGSLSKVRFSTQNAEDATLTINSLSVFPNPTTGNFITSFTSQKAQPLVLKICEAVTGKTIKTIFIDATLGNNNKSIALNTNQLSSGFYIILLTGDGITYKPTKLLLVRK